MGERAAERPSTVDLWTPRLISEPGIKLAPEPIHRFAMPVSKKKLKIWVLAILKLKFNQNKDSDEFVMLCRRKHRRSAPR